ncbi:RHS repeat domain-containing protein [Pseudomonas sp. Irchel 3A5]|uniref:RHS repeat domain-containing protein n=1 Tax=Pseudomonas sp. Irchel 3A5 TaxID=2008911 RepID=UPI00159596E0|nr:RHS repeat protein [Pseudomonas sp. Irchel 3A5]
MTVSVSSSVRSGAYNFLSFISSGVDPRTGTYSVSLSLSNLLANTLSGPSLPLALRSNALQTENLGFGVGWGIPFSSYNQKTKILNLSSGASHRAILSSNALVVTDKKVNDLKTSRLGSDLIIEHKSGVMEVLSNPGASRDEWLVSKIYSPEGRVVNLSYISVAGRRVLREIKDESRTLLTLDVRNDSARVLSMTLWPDNPAEKLVFRFQQENSRLTKITMLLDNNTSASWRLRYQTVEGLSLISRLESPTDGVEQLTYRTSALKLPNGAPLKALPAVASHVTFPRMNQAPITKKYSYSDRNYFGYRSNAPWNKDGDSLYKATGDYRYEVYEDLVEGTGANERRVRRTKRAYNRFHLQVEETVSQNGKTVSNITEFYEKPGLTFENQPLNFLLPKKVEVSWSDAAKPGHVRKETTLTEYDEFGNILKKVSPTGITEVFEYYPIGQSDGCPADAFGAVRWLKRKTLIPAADRAPAPTLITSYRYTHLQSASPQRGRFIALAQQAVSQSGQSTPLITITRQYESEINSPFFGRVKQQVETVDGIDTAMHYRYELLGGSLCTHTTLAAKDGSRSTKSLWQNSLTGAEVKTVEQLGVSLETAHDLLGRKILERLAPKTSSQVSTTHSYHLADALGDVVQTRTVAPNGAATLTRFDGMSRKCAVEVQDMDSTGQPMRATYNAKYDARGQLVEEVSTDWLDGRPFALQTQYRYDDWGHRVSTTGPDGVVSHDQFDPVTLVQTQGIDQAGKTVITKNVFGKNDSVERFDRKGVSCGITSYLYDGLGRCVQKIDPLGRTTRFVYDFADRLVITQLPDGTRIRKAFVRHSTEDLATHIWVNDYLAGERTYDGLMRVTSITVGGRTELFTYEGAQPNPATHIKASGKVISYKYDPSLNNQMTERSVGGNSNLAASYRYDSAHAKLIQASCPGNQQQRRYLPSGKLQNDQITEAQNTLNALHRTSLKGLPLEYVDATGVTQITRYDAFCRTAQVVRGTVRADYSYDSYGRVSRIETVDTQSKRKLITQLEYDDFGREVRRVLVVDSNPPEELSQQFDNNDKLIKRVLLRGSSVLRDETFAYDSRGRLERYACSGLHLPVDAAGKAIRVQEYQFDELDNIRQLKSMFMGGENIATYEYEKFDKTQLSRVRHSHPDYAAQQARFSYDRDGNQINDERGRRQNYDELGRLASVAQEQL